MSQEIIRADDALPMQLPIFVAVNQPVFPSSMFTIKIQNTDEFATLRATEESGGYIGFLLKKEPLGTSITPDDLYDIGTVGRVHHIEMVDGLPSVFFKTIRRFKITKFLSKEPPLISLVDYIENIYPENMDELRVLSRNLLAEVKIISKSNPFMAQQIQSDLVHVNDPSHLCDVVAGMLNADRKDQQKILDTLDIKDRFIQVIMLVKKEQELLRIQKKVSAQINTRLEKSQREYFLKEELKAIKAELGENVDGKSSDYRRFKQAIDLLQLESEVKELVERELEKFSLLEPSSSEYSTTRNYLETIINLPWNASDTHEISMEKSLSILENDHYGLEDVKERIIEYIAVRKLKNDNKGGIICLVGPPGVGKTSVGKSIAKALGRQFFRFSVGGMNDEAEIKGHRRTYVGAMPGKIIQGLKITHQKNPVFLIDEIDKMGISRQGDPSSALLEVLDPEQNKDFRDHYLDLPFDLSQVLFIITANTLDTIPSPLLDRMEIIRISGYTEEEKIEIAKRYIIPKSLKENGMTKSHIRYEKSALKAIINGYAREAGLRNFEKLIHRIHRKVAAKVVTTSATDINTVFPLTITQDNLEQFLKKPIFKDDETRKINKPGMVIGLAWTSFGGDTLMIEAVAIPSDKGGGLHLTGQMGDVMKESASIAHTYAQLVAHKYGASKDFFDKHHIHLHIPAGATPKDGPSAGITMASTLISLATGKKCPKGWAMTGELSLTGNVLAIGGLKEKSLAAKRIKIKDIIIPKANINDLDEIGDNIKNGINYHPVEKLEEVLHLLFDI